MEKKGEFRLEIICSWLKQFAQADFFIIVRSYIQRLVRDRRR
jgi:hypothetical protein